MQDTERLLKSELKPLTSIEIDELLKRFDEENSITYSPVEHKEENKQKKLTKIQVISRSVEEASKQMEGVFHFIQEKNDIPIEQIKSDIVPVMKEAAEIPHIFHLFEELHERDDYTFRHNICVGVIAGVIGKWLGYDEKQIRELELAGLLHDIGKTKVPLDVLNKPSKLTSAEYNQLKNHTIYGYSLLKRTSGLPESVALVALQHHERNDGLGYPFRIMSNKIHTYAKIMAIADVFHAMLSERPYKPAMPLYDVLMEMDSRKFGQLDPEILFIFMQNMMKTLVGKKVCLTDGSVGTVIMNHPFNPTKSIVHLEDNSIVDLQKDNNLKIKNVIND